MKFRRRRPPETPAAGNLLDFYGATQHALPRGWWVYALHQADGTVFRVGQTESLISRLRDHIYTFGPRLYFYSLVSCRDAHQADARELALIDWYEEQGIVNLAGTAEVEALRRRIRAAKGGSGLKSHTKELRETG